MDNSRKPLQWLVWGALLATIIGISVAFLWSRLTADKSPDLFVIGTVPNFSLTNQDSRPYSKESLLGHVTLADIIFTRCGGPCPEMTRKMSRCKNFSAGFSVRRFLVKNLPPLRKAKKILTLRRKKSRAASLSTKGISP